MMNADEFTQYVGSSTQIARRWLRRGLPGTRKIDGQWVIDDPQVALAHWRALADHSKSSLSVQRRAILTGRTTLPSPKREIEPSRDAVQDQMAEYLAWLLNACKAAPGLDDSDGLQLQELFSDYVAARLPASLEAWTAGRITPAKDF
jgi:hypothetical protein